MDLRSDVGEHDTHPRKRRRDPHSHGTGELYWVLVAVLAAFFLLALWWPAGTWVKRFAEGASEEVFGIIITLAFVQRLLQRQERARRLRASIGAFRRAGRALSRCITAWADILKGCYPAEDPPRDMQLLFAPRVTENIAYLDLRMRRTDADQYETWGRWLLNEVDESLTELNRVAVAYGGALDPAYTEAVDELIDDPFVQLLRRLIQADADPLTWRQRMNTNRGHRDDYFRDLLATVELHDRLAAEAATVRSRERAPRTGALGMELPRDHDLKVILRLDRDWRTAPPTPGSLRAQIRDQV